MTKKLQTLYKKRIAEEAARGRQSDA